MFLKLGHLLLWRERQTEYETNRVEKNINPTIDLELLLYNFLDISPKINRLTRRLLPKDFYKDKKHLAFYKNII